MPTLTITGANYRLFYGLNCPWPQGRFLESVPGSLGPRPAGPPRAATVKAADVIEILDEKKLKELIRAEQGTFLHDLTKDLLPAKDQRRTNFCWINAVARAAEIAHAYQTSTRLSLSAAAGACKITNFRNIGGYVADALDWTAENGLPRVDQWPNDAIDRQFDTPDVWVSAKDHCVLRYVQVNGWLELINCEAHRIPVAAEHNWWNHAVCHHTPELTNAGELLTGFDNSWGATFGENGYANMDKSKGTPSGTAYGVLSETLSTD